MNQNLSLKKLKGIKPKGVKSRLESTNLDFLLDAESKVLELFKEDRAKNTQDFYSKVFEHDSTRLRSFRHVVQNWVAHIFEEKSFSATDLESYILTRSFNYDFKQPESLVVGMYSGCLLSRLTQENYSKNKSTDLRLCGGNSNFDYLFFCAKTVDKLFIDSFVGSHICSHLSNKGTLNLVSLTNCKGDWFLNNINPAQGNPKLYVLVNHVGSNASVGEHLAAGGLVVSYNCVNAWTIRPTNHYSDYSLHEGSIDKILFLSLRGLPLTRYCFLVSWQEYLLR